MNATTHRIDVFVTSDVRRGAEVFGERLVEGLTNRGWDAELVSLFGSDRPSIHSTALTRGSTRGYAPATTWAVRRRLLRRRPQIVFANGGATLRHCVLASMAVWPRPRVVYGSIGEPSFWLRGTAHRLLQRALIAGCARVTAVSEATRLGLEKSVGVRPAKITVVNPGVDERWFEIGEAAPEPGPLRVLFAGSLSREKDPLTAVAAVEGLDGAVRLRMVGLGPLEASVRSAAGPGVELLGSVGDMSAQFEWADVLLLTSLTEGLPGVAVEASAAGVPVVASRVGGTSEVVVHAETGLLVDAGDVEGFVDALKQLALDPGLRIRMGAAARVRAAQRFRLEESIDRYAWVFEEVAAG